MKIEIELSQDPVIQKCYDDAKANIQTYIDRLSFCERLDPIVNLDYGKVVASSGFRVSSQTRHALDWALIGVDHTRIGENKVSHAIDEVQFYFSMIDLTFIVSRIEAFVLVHV